MNRDIEVLQEKLRAHLPQGHRITGLRQLTAGHSNETYIIEGLDAILRLPPITAPLLEAHGIITQAEIYQEVGSLEGGPPVPGIQFVCADPQILGAPFFIMDLVAGRALDDYELPAWFTSLPDEGRSHICHHWITAIGSIATLPPITAMGDPLTPEDNMRHWRRIAQEADFPRLTQLFGRLLGIPAPRSGPPGVVHGDCKITNVMFNELRVAAVLDWELGYNGEPLSDLGYLLYFFKSEYHGGVRTTSPTGMWQRDQVITAWERASGRSSQGLIWYEAAEMGKMAGIYARATRLPSGGESDDPRMLTMAAKLDESMNIMEAMLPRVEELCV
jgi:aminoglycoside phosphotransferase (APT) family kinase protein